MRYPKHIGIIPDGNRRWAEDNGMNRRDGYNKGLNPGLELFKLAQKYGIKEISYYGFTTDNCKRPADQVKAFTKACVDAVDMISEYDSDLLVVGNYKSKMFPKELMKYTTRQKIGKGGIKVNFLVNYGWEWDLGEIDEKNFNRKNILNSIKTNDISKVDLVIRWGGRRRLSGFLPVQSVYADFYVIDKMWPDFESKDFIEALEWYDKQDVTLGG